ncbi:hypothetical protein CPB86DRAFT_818397 [Serendipita vermifera]|nr:hypothetical protein CPB86DRAFT_818397 [Serendipita vermifera]
MSQEIRYQYSSLFAAGLLMSPRSASMPHGTQEDLTPTSESAPVDLFAPLKLVCKLPEPIMVTGPQSPQRKQTRRRRSSVTFQTSPVAGIKSAQRSAEEAWGRFSRLSGGSLSIAGSSILEDVATQPPSKGSGSEAQESNETTPTKLTYTQPRKPTPLRRGTKRPIMATTPKPAPTSPLPDIPTFTITPITPAKQRKPFNPVQEILIPVSQESRPLKH